MYRYGGEEAICLTGPSALLSVINACEELQKTRGERGEYDTPLQVFPFVKQTFDDIDKETQLKINKACFDFLQQIFNKRPWIAKMTTTKAFRGIFCQWDDQGIMCSVFPKSNKDELHTFLQYQSQWSSLVRKVGHFLHDNKKKRQKNL